MSDLPSWAVKGASVVRIRDGGWHRSVWPIVRLLFGRRRVPAVGEICQIDDVEIDFGEVWIGVAGYPDFHFTADEFRPLTKSQTNTEIEAEIYHKKGRHQSASRRSKADA